MYQGKKIIVIIPARSGSQGLPNKNIKVLNGKPVLVWTIESALKSAYVDEVMVSTDSQEYADIAIENGANVPFLRPEYLAGAKISTADVVIYTIDEYKKIGKEFDLLIVLEPTSPLRKRDDIDNCIRILVGNYDKADSVVSCGEVHTEHPGILVDITEDGRLVWYTESKKIIFQRQQLDKVYFPYGVCYLSKVEEYVEKKTFYQNRTLPYEIERWQNYEIDDIYDFLAIENILKFKLGLY